MFCVKCGVELKEETNFCPECGAVQKPEAQEKPRIKNKAPYLLLCAGVAVIVTVIALLCSNHINSSPEKVAAATIQATFEMDVETLVQTIPDFTIREQAHRYDLPETASRKQFVNAMKELVSQMGEQSQTVKIISSEISGHGRIRDMLWDYYGMTRDEYNTITDYVIVDVECLIDGDERYFEVSCIEMNDKWYVLDMD